ncbi:MAG: peptidylprolyl isomerase [Acidobacteriia bacterium]|nr:peptidylprolyl isomerase [Terriglobia bacterium]
MRTLAPLLLATLLLGCAPDKTAEKKTAPAPAPVKPPGLYKVKVATSKGDFVIEVHRDWAPQGADHFFELLQTRFYDGVRFHRVVRGFVCQFGINANPKLQQIWGSASIPDDPVKQKNKRGTISYAKLGPNSRTTQIFINLADNALLDSTGFAPIGKVVEGMDVVGKLYFAYGEVAPRGGGPDPTQIELRGNVYLDRSYPRLDSILRATLETPSPKAIN